MTDQLLPSEENLNAIQLGDEPPQSNPETEEKPTPEASKVYSLLDPPPPPRSDAIEQFVENYAGKEDQEQWDKLKKRAEDIFTEQLEKRDVRANVTGRIKKAKTLRVRLYQFQPSDKKFEKPDDILDGRWDFVGIRIALYFPNQQNVVEEIIKGSFLELDDYRRKFHGDERVELQTYQNKFGGYDAQHYWARLRPEDRRDVGRYSKQMFEIQLRSVIMDSWATITHDLEYKALAGDLSLQEYRVLDSVKGLVKTGEVMLEHLREVHLARVRDDLEEIKSEIDLARILPEHLPEIRTLSTSNFISDDFVPLFIFLRSANITTTGFLRSAMKRLNMAKKLTTDFQQWTKDFYPLPAVATTLDFILYSILEQLPGEAVVEIWEKAMIPIMQNANRSRDDAMERFVTFPIQSPTMLSLFSAFEYLFDSKDIVTPVYWELSETGTEIGMSEVKKVWEGYHSARVMEGARLFKDLDAEVCAMIWYGTLCSEEWAKLEIAKCKDVRTNTKPMRKKVLVNEKSYLEKKGPVEREEPAEEEEKVEEEDMARKKDIWADSWTASLSLTMALLNGLRKPGTKISNLEFAFRRSILSTCRDGKKSRDKQFQGSGALDYFVEKHLTAWNRGFETVWRHLESAQQQSKEHIPPEPEDILPKLDDIPPKPEEIRWISLQIAASYGIPHLVGLEIENQGMIYKGEPQVLDVEFGDWGRLFKGALRNPWARGEGAEACVEVIELLFNHIKRLDDSLIYNRLRDRVRDLIHVMDEGGVIRGIFREKWEKWAKEQPIELF